MIHQMVFHSYFFVPMGKIQLLWLRVMMPFIRKSLQAAHFVSQFSVLISFLRIFLIEAKTAITSEVLIFFFIIRKLLASG